MVFVLNMRLLCDLSFLDTEEISVMPYENLIAFPEENLILRDMKIFLYTDAQILYTHSNEK